MKQSYVLARSGWPIWSPRLQIGSREIASRDNERDNPMKTSQNANPLLGNKAGGLTTTLEKSLRAMAKARSQLRRCREIC
jgi:hypothetical protein